MVNIQYLMLIGVLIILALGLFAAFLWGKVFRQQKKREQELSLQKISSAAAVVEQRLGVNKSIQLLAHAIDRNELSLTEASIRIAGLLDYLGVEEDVKNEFSAFFQLRDLTVHIPVLESWQSLTNPEKNKFDLERIQHEATYNDFILDATKRILGRSF